MQPAKKYYTEQNFKEGLKGKSGYKVKEEKKKKEGKKDRKEKDIGLL